MRRMKKLEEPIKGRTEEKKERRSDIKARWEKVNARKLINKNKNSEVKSWNKGKNKKVDWKK